MAQTDKTMTEDIEVGATGRPTDDNDKRVTIAMLSGGQWRVYFGDDTGGRYVNVDYDDIRDYVICRRPRAELVALYNLAD